MSHDRTSLQHLQQPPKQPKQQYKIKIPRSAASYTPATMDLDLRSKLNIQLIAGGYDKKIQEHVLYALNAHPNNWPTQVQSRALAILRSGEATTFPQLLKQVLEEVRRETSDPTASQAVTQGSSSTTAGDSAAATSNGGTSGSNGDAAAATAVNGASKKANGASANPGPGEAGNLHTNTSTSLAVPRSVVEDALKVTREALLSVAEFSDEENGAT